MNRRTALKASLGALSCFVHMGKPLGADERRTPRRIATEEHFLLPDYISAANKFVQRHPNTEKRAWLGRGIRPLKQYALMGNRIADFDRRLEYMDRDGIDMQVLSLMQPGVQIFDSKEGAAMAIEVNNQITEIVQRNPSRFVALAAIAPQNPNAAAKELERAVEKLGMKGAVINSHTKNEYLDNEKFWPILEAAEALNVPIYLHPRDPAAGIYDHCNYGGLQMIWGFGADASLHALRLILSGAFDRFPNLQLVLGHLGEGIPFALDRIDNRFEAIPVHYKANLPRKIRRRPSEYFRANFTVTSSGQNWGPAVRFCQEVLGPNNVMFGADYPFEDQALAVHSADAMDMTDKARRMFFHENASRVFGVDCRDSAQTSHSSQ